MMVKQVERNDTLDALKGFTILLVMLGHCIVLNDMADGIVYDVIKAIQMPLFMMISGYLGGKTLDIRNGKELRQKIAKRAVAYLVPFVSWIFITNITTFPSTFKSILFQLDRGLWFLVVLFFLSVTLYVAVYLQECVSRGVLGFIMVYGAVGALLILQIQQGNTFLGPHLMLNYLPFHLFGYVVAKYWKWDIKEKKIRFFVFGGTLLFGYLIAKFDMIVAANRVEWLIQILTSFLGSLVCIYFMYRLRNGKVKKALAYIGLYTLEIYVLHFRFARILDYGGNTFGLYSVQGMVFILASFVIMSMLTAFFISILKKWKTTDFLLFGKAIKH